jgi:hypothetical protein
MHIVLLALGVIVTVAGGAMTAFGIANNAFDIGNTMISAGMTGVVGGLIIVALASVALELRATRMPKAREPLRPAAAAAPAATPPETPSQTSAGAADLSQVLAEPASEPARAPPRAEPAPAAPRVEPAPPAPPPGDPFAPARADPQRRAAVRERGFDAVWAPEPAKAGAPPSRPAEPARESEPVAIRPPREPQAVSVLKSGVIEGMAYTLYSDGSIEADLPQGMVRFPSIDALRRHLAGQG